VTGIVVGIQPRGFFFETSDSEWDATPSTSEGMFVYTSAAPEVRVADRVRVDGTVVEYVPASTQNQLPLTELADPTTQVLDHGQVLPSGVVLGSAGTPIPDRLAASARTLDPAGNALDFYESLEGMRVAVPDAVVVDALDGSIVAVVADRAEASSPRTVSRGLLLTASDPNPERILVDTSALPSIDPVDVGARLLGPLTGVLDYRNGRYIVLADGTWPGAEPSPFERQVTRLAGQSDHWTVATFNAHNASPTDRAHLDAIGEHIALGLGAPDIVALQEIQDQNGTSPGELSAAGTLDRVCAAIVAAGGPEYRWAEIAPAREDADGGAPGGNIRVAYLYRADRVAMTSRGVPESGVAVTVANDHGRAHLSPLPGRIEPTDPAFTGSRKPLVAEFTRGAGRLIAITVHLTSRLGDDPIFGAVQPPESPSSAVRRAQVEVITGFVQRVQAIEPEAALVVVGDFNDFEYSPALAALAPSPLIDVTARLPDATRYSYVFEGNSQLLDHVLVSPALALGAEVEVVHANADFDDRVRCSDHDALVARIVNAE
jgi:predicted extracellular nuclease